VAPPPKSFAAELDALRTLLARAAESKEWSDARRILAERLPVAPAEQGDKK
jgi:hypothetical protein